MKEHPLPMREGSGIAPDRSAATRTTAKGSESSGPSRESPMLRAPPLSQGQGHPERAFDIAGGGVRMRSRDCDG